MNLFYRIACCGVLSLSCTAWAQDAHHAGMNMNMDMMAASAPQRADTAAPSLVEAQVIKVDPQNQKVTLKHGEIKSLNMPPMTMDYHVQDQALFAHLHPGGHIRFTARLVNGAYTVLTVEEVR
jgi:Cu/Ag efflux protein CusF